MLGNHPVDVMLLATDLDVARRFYSDTLGLPLLVADTQFLTFSCGGDSRLVVTHSTSGTREEATKASWRVDDLGAEVAWLRARGVRIQDLPRAGHRRWGGRRRLCPGGLVRRPAPQLDRLLQLKDPGVRPADRPTSTVSGHSRDERQDSMRPSADAPERLNAVITVHKYEPTPYEEPTEGPVLTRIHVQERFSGDIDGDGVVEFLQAGRADGSASFVGIERVTGQVAGRQGTFLLQDAGTVAGNLVSGEWFVVPGSGTGQLAGLRGTGGFRANLGEGAQVHLDYWFE
jgi:catechol 2,3-dioxygenase-like lactoylglutathione lyase family enzyme